MINIQIKGNYSNREWEAHTNLRDGYSQIVFSDGEIITIKNDGVTGYDFVLSYLAEMQQHYISHLKACDAKLKQRLGKAYAVIAHVPNRYASELALISLNCCFGIDDMIPDHEKDGTFHPEFTLCAERYSCPFNGFCERNAGNKIVGCNPVYECGLSSTQAYVAHLIVNTPMSYEEIANLLKCSYSNVDNIRRRIFEHFNIKSRQQLTLLLKDKRLF